MQENNEKIGSVSDRERWESDNRFKERELELKAMEVESTVIASKRSPWKSPLVVAVFAAAVAAFGNAFIATINGIQSRQLEDQKAESARVLAMINTGDADVAADNLQFLLDTGLINSLEVAGSLQRYLEERKPGEGPVLGGSGQATPDALSGQSWHIMTAGQSGQLCYSSEQLGGGLFTSAFVDALGGEADVSSNGFPPDGIITLDEIFAYVTERAAIDAQELAVPRRNTPLLVSLNQARGQFFFVRSDAEVAAFNDETTWGQRISALLNGDPQTGKSYAVVVANSEFQEFPDQPLAKNDGARVADLLLKQGFSTQSFIDQSKADLAAYFIDELPEKVAEDDRVLVYLTGNYTIRTLPSGASEAYLTFKDSRQNQYSSMIGIYDVLNWISGLRGVRHVLVVIDSCIDGVPQAFGGIRPDRTTY